MNRLSILFLSGKSITATKYIFDCLIHFLQYHNSIRIYSGLQIKLKPYKFCNSIRADSRQHIMSLRLNLLCPPLWAIFRVYALYSNRNANYFYLLRKVSLPDPELSLVFCLKLDLTYCEKVIAKKISNSRLKAQNNF